MSQTNIEETKPKGSYKRGLLFMSCQYHWKTSVVEDHNNHNKLESHKFFRKYKSGGSKLSKSRSDI